MVSAVGRGLPKVIAAVIVSLSKYVSCAFDFVMTGLCHGLDFVTSLSAVDFFFFLSWLSFSFILMFFP